MRMRAQNSCGSLWARKCFNCGWTRLVSSPRQLVQRAAMAICVILSMNTNVIVLNFPLSMRLDLAMYTNLPASTPTTCLRLAPLQDDIRRAENVPRKKKERADNPSNVRWRGILLSLLRIIACFQPLLVTGKIFSHNLQESVGSRPDLALEIHR